MLKVPSPLAGCYKWGLLALVKAIVFVVAIVYFWEWRADLKRELKKNGENKR